MPVKYVKMKKDGGWQNIEADRVERFLEEGWSMVDEPKSEKRSPRKSSKDAITADAQVTSSESEEEDIVEQEDWDIHSEEWADSEEALSDLEDETANKEE